MQSAAGTHMKIIYHHRTRSTDAQRIHIQEMIRAFEELGHEVETVSLVPTNAGQDDARRDAGDAVWKKPVRRIPFAYEIVQLGYNMVGIPMLLRKILHRNVDFIYERYSLFNFAGVVVARLCGVPLILEVNSPFALEQSRDKDIRLVRLAAWTERVVCNAAAHVVVVSTPLQRIMVQAGIRASRLVVMPNGVDLHKFKPQPASAELRRSLGLDGAAVIGFVGWFRKWHGLELLLEAFHRSGLAARNAKVLLIGDGQAMADLRDYVAAHDLKEHVIFTGPLPHAQVPPYLDLIDIAVQPAANEYCCPMKILEYMALGKPIVAPRQENIQDLLREGEEALFFSPGDAASMADALTTLVNNREGAARMGRKGREAIERRGYLWTENARKVAEMVEGTVKKKPVTVSG
jgi:glycosyltransferase involved in cell wall biosynthesis